MTPEERRQPGSEELVSLNADELDENALEEVAGGTSTQPCTLIVQCSPNYMNPAEDKADAGTAI